MPGAAHRLRLNLKRVYLMGRGAVTFVVGAAIAVMIVAAIVALGRDLLGNAIRIDALQVPKALIEAGVSPEVAARRLRDGMTDIVTAASTSGKNPSLQLAGDVPNIVVPTVGISFSDLTEFLRSAIGWSRRVIGGEITGESPHAQLRLRIDGRVFYEADDVDMRDAAAWHGAAEAILRQTSPYIVAWALLETNPAAAEQEANRIIAMLPPVNENVAWAHLLLGASDLGKGRVEPAIPEIRQALTASRGRLAAAHFYLGVGFIAQGRWQEAEQELRTSSRLDPTDAGTDHYLAVALWGEGELPAAQAQFAIAEQKLRDDMRREPGNAITIRSFANSLQVQGRVEEALELARRALEHDPHSAGTRLVVATLENEAGWYEAATADAHEAASESWRDGNSVLAVDSFLIAPVSDRWETLRMLDRVIADDPDYAMAYEVRAQLRQQLGRQADADADNTRALSLSPALPIALLNEGMRRGRSNDADAAGRAFQAACDVGLPHYDCLIAWSHFLEKSDPARSAGLLADALKELDSLVAAFPRADKFRLDAELVRQQHKMAQAGLASPPLLPAYQSARCRTLADTDRTAAMAYCERAVRLAPQEPAYREQLADLIAADGSDAAYDRAIAVLLDALAVSGRRSSTLIALARDLGALHQTDAARLTLAEAVKLDEDNGWLHNEYANALDAAGMSDDAIRHYRRSWELQPDDVVVADNLARALFRAGLFEEALAPARFVFARKPDDSTDAVRVAECLDMSGRWAESRQAYAAWIAAHPQDSHALNERGISLARHALFADAVTDFQAANKLAPDDRVIAENLSEARELLRRAATQPPPPPAGDDAVPTDAAALGN
jgi:tetratricopeptide (TPR) repeat protein